MNIEELLKAGVEKGASDLHILPNSAPLFRVSGLLLEMKDTPKLTPTDCATLIDSMMTPIQRQTFEKMRVSEFQLTVPDVGYFRVSVFHQLNGVAAVIRIIPATIPNFEDLNLPTVLKSLLVLSHGLILVTGPAGSGKSTTIAAMLNYINNFRACHILTIEDPIEYIHTSKKSIFNQLQVGRDTPDFATALRASMRQDPNVIVIGELRDLETMRLALIAAETGHLVLGTLHASSAPMAVGRFVDVFPPEEKNLVRSMLAETIQAIIGQTLVKKNTGGRIAAFEILLAITAVRHYIHRDMASHLESAMQTNSGKGMCTLEQSLNELVTKNLINQSAAATVLAMRGTFRDVPDPKDEKEKSKW
jgi:twitching motility protein PilT